MPYTYALIGGLLGTLAISGLATGAVRRKCEELSLEARDAILRRGRFADSIARIAEWLGVALLIMGLLPKHFGLPSYSGIWLVFTGLAVFGIANIVSSWVLSGAVSSAAPGTAASRSARTSALIVSGAELGLILLVFWVVGHNSGSVHGWLRSVVKTGAEPSATQESSTTQEEDHAVWLEESAALKEVPNVDKDYIQGLVLTGKIRTRTVAGKTLYNLDDVRRLKERKPDALPE